MATIHHPPSAIQSDEDGGTVGGYATALTRIFCRKGQGNLETLTSPPSTKVQNVNDKPIGSPQLAGNAREEDALVVDTSLIADEDGVGI